MKKFFSVALPLILLLTSIHPVTAEGPMSLQNIAVPETLGKIQERFVGSNSTRWIIQIQDVHAHLTAQENIAAILDHLNAVYGIKTAALEGGSLSTSFPTAWSVPNSREKQNLARGLLEDGYLTGAGYAALFSVQPLRMVGIEQQDLYESNRSVYINYLAQKEPTDEALKSHDEALQASKAQVYSPELLKFDSALRDFRSGKEAAKFLPLIVNLADLKQIDLSGLGQIQIFKKILLLEKAISKDKLNAEAARIMEPFKKTRLSFEEVLRSGQIPEDQLQYYTETLRYKELMALNDQVVHLQFFSELEQLIGLVKSVYITAPEEKDLDARSERFLLAKKIIQFQATPDDLNKYDADTEAVRQEAAAAGLEEALRLGLQFYDIARSRDQIFFDKIMSDPSFTGDLAVVTGGFHTDGLSAKLRDAGISYVVIAPDLGGQAPDESLYFKKLSDPLASSQTLQYPLLFLDDRAFDSKFPDAIDVMRTKRDIRLAVGLFYTGVSVDTSADSSPNAAAKDFTKLPLDEKLSLLRKWLSDATQTPDKRMVLVVTAADLKKLLEDPLALKLWDSVKTNHLNTIAVIAASPADMPENALGARAKVVPISGATIEEVVQSEVFQNRFKTNLKSRTIAGIFNNPSGHQAAELLELPLDPLALLFRLFLSQPELRGQSGNPAFLDLIRGLLIQIEGFEEFQKAA